MRLTPDGHKTVVNEFKHMSLLPSFCCLCRPEPSQIKWIKSDQLVSQKYAALPLLPLGKRGCVRAKQDVIGRRGLEVASILDDQSFFIKELGFDIMLSQTLYY